MPKKSWLERYWDRILTAVLSTIIAGVVGFFAALRTMDADISSIKQDIASLKSGEKIYVSKSEMQGVTKDVVTLQSTVETLIKPSLASFDESRKQLNSVELRLIKVEAMTLDVKDQSHAILVNQLQSIQFTSGRVSAAASVGDK